MKNQLVSLACRRRRLLEKIEAQRMEMAVISLHWQKPLALVDTGLKAVCFIRSHPAWVASGVAALLALRRKGIVGLAQEGWRLWRFYPSIISLAIRSPSEKRNTEVDH